jgi:hypothetical protein
MQYSLLSAKTHFCYHGHYQCYDQNDKNCVYYTFEGIRRAFACIVLQVFVCYGYIMKWHYMYKWLLEEYQKSDDELGSFMVIRPD